MIIATRARPLWFRIPVIMVRIVAFGKTLVHLRDAQGREGLVSG
jgi:hypothetical protein